MPYPRLALHDLDELLEQGVGSALFVE